MHAAVFGWAVVVGNVLLLNGIGLLSPWIVASSVPLSAWLLSQLGRSQVQRGRLTEDLDAPRRRIDEVSALDICRRVAPVGHFVGSSVLVGVLLLALGRSAFHIACSFPSDWDTLAYHAPLVDNWVRDNSLTVMSCPYWWVPGNAEILAYWLVGCFSGDFLICGSNLLPASVCIAAANELLRTFGVSGLLRSVAVLAIVATVPFWRQIGTGENDVAVVALLLAALTYSVRSVHDGEIMSVTFSGLSLGLLFGTKYLAIGYGAVVGVGLLFLMWGSDQRRPGKLGALAAITGVGGFGAYWYIRNFAVTGSPVYPATPWARTDLWTELYPCARLGALVANIDEFVISALLHNLAETCGPLCLLAYWLAPAVLVLLVTAPGIQGQSRTAVLRRRWLALIVVLSNVVFLLTPHVVETVPGTQNVLLKSYQPIRLGFAAVSVTFLAFCVLLSDLLNIVERFADSGVWSWQNRHGQEGKLWSLSAKSLTIPPIATACYFGYESLGRVFGRLCSDQVCTPAATLMGAAATALLVVLVTFAAGTNRSIFIRVCSGCCSAVLVVGFIYWRSQTWHVHYDEFFDRLLNSPVVTHLNRLPRTNDRILACMHQYYPLIGSDRRNSVFRPMRVRDRRELGMIIDEIGATIVVATNVDTTLLARYSVVADVLSGSACFELLFNDGVYTCASVRDCDHAEMSVP